jgi:hypothetical protein
MKNIPLTIEVTYLVSGEKRPVYFASEAGADAALNISADFEKRKINVQDARDVRPAASLDRESFALARHNTNVHTFYGLDFQQQLYEQEISELVMQASGSTRALVFDHTLRPDSAQVRARRNTREPAAIIHNDYTDQSAHQRVVDLLGARQARDVFTKRFAIINVWRSVAGAVLRSPMACCDATTIAPEDLVASERRAKERVGEIELATWNPAHRWYYYPELANNEALLIKTFDSSTAGIATRTIHTAFDDPFSPETAPPRESIESRLLVFFD